MKEKSYWLVAGLVAIGMLIMAKGYVPILKVFLVKWEGFSSLPYWDIKQWSWGYGSRVPGSVNDPGIKPVGSITRQQALDALIGYTNRDYLYLKSLLKIPLSPEQWAALLSFSYNLGRGNADNLIPNINTRNWAALQEQWKKYIYADNQVDQELIERRAAEWELFKRGLT